VSTLNTIIIRYKKNMSTIYSPHDLCQYLIYSFSFFFFYKNQNTFQTHILAITDLTSVILLDDNIELYPWLYDTYDILDENLSVEKPLPAVFHYMLCVRKWPASPLLACPTRCLIRPNSRHPLGRRFSTFFHSRIHWRLAIASPTVNSKQSIFT